jgi:tetratricopeptide (TPR) repeat protein
MDTLMIGDYQTANRICDRIEAKNPGHPAADYGRACAIYAHVTDFEDTTGRARFFELCNSAISACNRLKNSGVTDRATASYIEGSTLATQALMLHREGGTLKALRLIMAARSEFQEAIDSNPVFYDAYLGRGAYRYAVATHASLVSWLPFIPSAESGWRDMWLAVDSSKFSRYSALSSLVWFVLEKKDYALADSICRAGLERFPGCRSFLWAKLAMHQRQKQWAETESVARELLGQYLAHPDNNGYDAIGLYATLMTCADSLGRPDDALKYARQGLAAFRKDDVSKRRKDKLELMERRLAQGESAHRDHD